MQKYRMRANGTGAFASSFLPLILVVSGMLQAGCSFAEREVTLQGAGATFPNPIYQQWFSIYVADHPNVKFDYQAIGSGGGQKQILARTVDFAASDAPLKDKDLASAPGAIIHIPSVLGAVVITYSLPSLTRDLQLTPETLAKIYLGKIKKWNDPAIKAVNQGIALPAVEISVTHRSDGSGTTFVFTDYLSKVSQEWQRKVGSGTLVDWPVGVGAKGNEGVAQLATQTVYSIAYVELKYAMDNHLRYALMMNAAGCFIKPTLESITAAAGTAQVHDDLRVSITDAPGKDAYPIASFTYLLAYQDQTDQTKARALVDFLWWATHEGQGAARRMMYAPLPEEIVGKVEGKIRSITCQGRPLYER